MEDKTADEIIEHIGNILIELRKDPTKEFVPAVLRHLLLQIKEAAAFGGKEKTDLQRPCDIVEESPRWQQGHISRPAFHVDDKLKEAAKKAAEVFEEEEKTDLERLEKRVKELEQKITALSSVVNQSLRVVDAIQGVLDLHNNLEQALIDAQILKRLDVNR